MGLPLITRRNLRTSLCRCPRAWQKCQTCRVRLVVAPTSRLPKKNIQETAQKVMAAADKISQALGNQFRKVA